MRRGIFFPMLLYAAVNVIHAFPSSVEDFRYMDRDYNSPGPHQLASSWLTSQLCPKVYAVPIEFPVLQYRLPLQRKRNSEVANAIIGSEETQKMYRDGRK